MVTAIRIFLPLLCASISLLVSATAQAQLEEVVVTAQKRTENLQDVPIAVTSLSGQAIEEANLPDIAGLTALAPSLNFTLGSSDRNSSLRIRGLGTDSFNVGIEPSVSIVVDGVVQTRPSAAFARLTDVERVEILRGPQGTLFGKNASVGALNIVTRKPNLDQFEGRVEMGVAGNNEYSPSGMISGPLSQNVAYRLNASYQERDGVVDNVFTGGTSGSLEYASYTGKLLWQPTDASELIFTVDHYYRDTNCCGTPLLIDGIDGNAVVQISSADYMNVTPGPENDDVALDLPQSSDQDQSMLSLHAEWGLGEHTITSITAFTDFAFGNFSDRDNTPAQLQRSRSYTDAETFTQEFRLASPSAERYDYVLGLFYYDSDVARGNYFEGYRDNDPTDILSDGTLVGVDPSGLRANQFDAAIDIRNYAAFGQFNYRPTDDLTLLLGFRALREEQSFTYEDVELGPGGRLNSNSVPFFEDSIDDDALIGKVGLQYAFSDSVNAYVTLGTGYKGAAYRAQNAFSPQQAAAGEASLDAETSDSYEIGLKSMLLSDRVQLNVAAYQVEFEGFQAQAPDLVNGGNINQNIGEVHQRGVEVEVDAAPVENLRLTAGINWSDNRIEEGFTGCYGGQTLEEGCLVDPETGRNFQNIAGGELQNAPDLRYILKGRYGFEMANGYQPYFMANYAWQDDVQYQLNQDPRGIQEAYGILNLSAGVASPEDTVEVSLYIKNALDEQYVAGYGGSPGNAGGQGDLMQTLPRNFERYWGARLVWRF